MTQYHHTIATRVPVHRDDGELLGFLVPDQALWTACTVFGFPISEPESRQNAEALLHAYGLSYLADRWELHENGEWIAVNIVEANPEQVTVAFADYGHPDIFGTRRSLRAPDRSILRRE